MPRVLVLNNFPLDYELARLERGEIPDHVLFGINRFQELGYEMDIPPFQGSKVLQAVNKWLGRIRFPISLGNLDHQWAAWRRRDSYDIIYAPCADEINLLSYLRALGLWNKPIVNLLHHPPNRGRLTWLRTPFVRLMLRGTDAMTTLSKHLAQEINAECAGNATNSNKARSVRWGPQRSYYPVADGPGEGFICAGMTGRDLSVFGRAAGQTAHPVEIVCMPDTWLPELAQLPANVKVTVPVGRRKFSFPELLGRMSKARALAIPLQKGVSLSGLTGVMDGLALGRPLIVTRNPLLDLDIEALGIGKWVDYGDVEGWRAALEWFAARPEESMAMGKRARALVDEEQFNSDSFARNMVRIFDQVLAATGSVG